MTMMILGKKLQSKKKYVPSWCDLPQDILGSILERLSSKDQIRFRAVCKNWRLVYIKPHSCKLPWLFGDWFYRPVMRYKLYNPFGKEAYSIETNIKVNQNSCLVRHWNHDHKKTWFRNLAIISSGWSLSFLSETFQKPYICEVIFLYNPFTLEVINLPKFPSLFSQKALLFQFTFAYCPKDQCFVVYGGMRCKTSLLSVISWCSGDKTWKHIYIKLDDNFIEGDEIFKLAYIKGILYIIFTSGKVGALDKFNCWTNHTIISTFVNNVRLSLCELDDVVFEFEEDLFMVICREEQYQIFKLDWSLKNWVKEVSLGNRVLFLGTFGSALMLMVGERANKMAGRIIYYHGRDHSFRWSLYDNYKADKGLSKLATRRHFIRHNCHDKNHIVSLIWIGLPKY